ncbi:MAG: MFS transporter, partial [Planctomycetaceae bacterium]|nr:MFS transporter [Planctomycetaceae bacterium]
GVMLLGLIAFLVGIWSPGSMLWMLLVVLCFMGIQSAFFGPSKYGILPEMLRNDDLPQANGQIQMATFLAIILGTALAGYGKEATDNAFWKISLICVGIAVVGTLASLLVRRTSIAKPNLQFKLSALAINTSTRLMLWNDRLLLAVLLISSLFWFIGGVVLLAVNQLGKETLMLGDGRTSMMSACMGVGIGIGCFLAGRLSHHQINFSLVRKGAWGIAACLTLVSLMAQRSLPAEIASLKETETTLENSEEEAADLSAAEAEGQATVTSLADEYWKTESLWDKLIPISFWEFATRVALTGVGLFAGLFAVPLQTFMQSRPPADQKGQMIGAMNLINWIGILLAAFFLDRMQLLLNNLEWDQKWIFPILALMMLPVALFFKPPSEKLPHRVSPEPEAET